MTCSAMSKRDHCFVVVDFVHSQTEIYANMLSEFDVAKELLQINAIKLSPDEPFTWASGLKSPIYCDNRKTLSYPQLRTGIKATIAAKAKELWTYNKVAGVATAGIAHGALVAEHQELPFIYVRSSAKKHGAKNQIEGAFSDLDECLVIEDLISTGGSSIQAVEVLREAGIKVVGVAAIFTYEFDKAKENFAKANCPFFTLSNYSTLIEVAQHTGTINEEQIKSLRQWRTDPQQWSDEFKSA